MKGARPTLPNGKSRPCSPARWCLARGRADPAQRRCCAGVHTPATARIDWATSCRTCAVAGVAPAAAVPPGRSLRSFSSASAPLGSLPVVPRVPRPQVPLWGVAGLSASRTARGSRHPVTSDGRPAMLSSRASTAAVHRATRHRPSRMSMGGRRHMVDGASGLPAAGRTESRADRTLDWSANGDPKHTPPQRTLPPPHLRVCRSVVFSYFCRVLRL